MSKLLSRLAGFFRDRTLAGVDKAGNRYFTREEAVDGILKEKRWVIFKGEDDPTSIPVEWICWLNGQRKKPPTPEEMMALEARRELVRQNVARLKKEEEERKAKEGTKRKGAHIGKAAGPDLKSFIEQFPASSEGDKVEEESDTKGVRKPKVRETEKAGIYSESSEPTGSGESYRPGTWQPPT